MDELHTQTLELDSSVGSLRRHSSGPHRPWGRLMSLNSAYPHVDLAKDQVWLGRHADCDIQLPDGCISGKHCCIARRPDDPLPRASLEDNSSNGTFLNGERIPKNKAVRLRNRDEISLVVASSLEAQRTETLRKSFCSFIFQDLRYSTVEQNRTEGSLRRTITMELAPHLLDAKRARTAVRQRRYFEIDEDAIIRSGGVYTTAEGKAAATRTIRLKRPHVADSSAAAEQFKLAELAFRRFVNRDRMFSVSEVDLLVNAKLEEAFQRQESDFSARNGKNLRDSFVAATPRERRIIDALCDSIWWSTDGCSDGANPLLAWHGTKEENIPAISREGFRVLSERDTGWYGKGVYFTQLPNYGEFYINNCLSEHGESFSLVLSWVLMGRPYPVTAKMDGADCKAGYDSHFCLVKGFAPCPDNEDPTGDEVVIFRAAQVLPRYIVRYEVKKKAKFTPISLLDSSEEEGEEENGEQMKEVPNVAGQEVPAAAAKSSNAVPTAAAEDGERSLITDGVPEGEEGEQTICYVQARIYFLINGQWIDKGVGRLKVQLDSVTKRARFVLRSATGAVVFNHPVLAGIRMERADAKSLRTIMLSRTGVPFTALLRTPSSEETELLHNALTRLTAQ